MTFPTTVKASVSVQELVETCEAYAAEELEYNVLGQVPACGEPGWASIIIGRTRTVYGRRHYARLRPNLTLFTQGEADAVLYACDYWGSPRGDYMTGSQRSALRRLAVRIREALA